MAIASNFPAIRPSLNLDFANARALDPRITFGRASAATYYDGKTVAKAEENLLVRSQEFDHAVWSASSAVPTITANAAAAPDGTSTAHRIVFPAADSRWRQGLALTSGTAYTISIYARSNTGGDQTFRLWGQDAAFNSADLTATTSWQRFTYTFTASSSATFAMGIRTSVANAAADLLIWGMQVEARSTVTAYTPTTTQPITNYIPVLQTAPAGVPRFDHNPMTGESLGLLVEEQRTNLLKYSQDFSQEVFWQRAASVAQQSVTTAPDGTMTAAKLVTQTGQSIPVSYAIQPTTKAASSGIFTASVFLKPGGFDSVTLILLSDSSVNRASAEMSLTTGVLTGSLFATGGFSAPSASITSVGNGWYRFSLTATSDALTTLSLRINLKDSVKTVGDGYSGIYIWGAQLETGSFPTSYIKTEASQVTRAADSASMTGANFSSWYRQDEGTLVADSKSFGPATVSGTGTAFSVTDGTINNRIRIGNYVTGGISSSDIATAGVVQASWSTTVAVANYLKSIIAYKFNDIAAVFNAGAVQLDNGANIPIVLQCQIGNAETGRNLNGHIKRITYYPKRLSDAQLQALTA